MRSITTGDVYMVDFATIGQSERGYRPAIIVSNNKGNRFSKDIIVVPLTTAKKSTYQPTHVSLRAADNGLPKDSTAVCEAPLTIPKRALRQYCTTLCEESMRDVAFGLIAATSTLAFLDGEMMMRARTLSIRLRSA